MVQQEQAEKIKGLYPINPKWPQKKVKNSSQIDEMAYDPRNQKLFVLFVTNGSLYTYHPVPEKFQKGLFESPSAGAYFAKNIRKDKTITCKKV